MARKVLVSLKSILSEAQRRGLVAQNAAQPVRVDMEKRARRRARHPVDGRGSDNPVQGRWPVASVARYGDLHRHARLGDPRTWLG